MPASEADRVDAAVEDALKSIEAGDLRLVAVNWAAENHDVEHRREDIHERVLEVTDDDE
ncbi:hypothetical protein [Salinigranum rubrum]|uniref:hypothetical protein n=1 Tax=Salinigranum rubrum TaxID=755307 RepID=UPI0013A57984|nr:hypothetical protein [Salinigranum rubrum]